jgi:hypothetical protein
MSKTLQILLAEPVIAQIGDRSVTVREIDWAHLLAFAEKIAGLLGSISRVGADGKVAFALSLDSIGPIIQGSAPLSRELLAATTDLSAEEIDKLPARVALRLLDLALEVNLTEDFSAAVKALAARLQGAAPAQTSEPSSKT